MPEAALGAGETRWRRAGTGRPIVFIHGVGMASSVWAPQIEAFALTHTAIAYDMLGHGGSALPPERPGLKDYSDQLRSLLDELDLGRAVVVGHSMGALVALEFALNHPDRTLGVAALNAVYRRTPAQREAVLDRARRIEAEGPGGAVDGTIARWFGNPVPAALAEVADKTRAFLESADPVGYARTYRLFASADAAHAERLGGLAVPALFLTGEEDPNSSPEMSRAMAAAVPRGRAEILPGERHMMSLTAPALVNARLRAFAEEVP
ncbi:alpha/beta fold hydrolase [Inquilinus sp. NPDC058860]|uniref:alpha/beta fold hydrolase n=1 Tax=Inquilinus sp. NPDC058860 TaxID=3346652 RepID=UPI003682C68C